MKPMKLLLVMHVARMMETADACKSLVRKACSAATLNSGRQRGEWEGSGSAEWSLVSVVEPLGYRTRSEVGYRSRMILS
jgi:hypothetical protein